MRHQCKVTVLDKKCFPDLQERYLADPASGPCPCFEVGQEFLFSREDGRDDFWHFGRDLDPAFPCAEAWDCVSRYIYTVLQGGSIMHGWTNDERVMIACCNDGTRPVVFMIERIDLPETEAEAAWLAGQDRTSPTPRRTPTPARESADRAHGVERACRGGASFSPGKGSRPRRRVSSSLMLITAPRLSRKDQRPPRW